MADRVTRCPKCSTSFRITDAQLEIAKGAVRCGSCLHIFKALDHVVAPVNQPEDTASAVTDVTPESEDSHTEDSHTEEPHTEELRTEDNQPEDDSDNRLSFDQEQINSDTSPLDDDDEDLLISDDMDKDIDNTTPDITLGSELSENFLAFDNPSPKASLFEREIQETKEEKDTTDESWAVHLLNDLDDEPEPPAHEEPYPPLAEDDDDFDYSNKTTGSFQALDDQTLEAALGEPLSERPEPRFSLAPTEEKEELAEFEQELEQELEQQAFNLRQDMLDGIDPGVVELEHSRPQKHWPRRLLWGGLSLLALFVLIAQTAFFKFDHWSRIEPFRQYYASICPLIGCQLPALSDRRQIKTHNLLIRSHPTVDNALVVDAIILNQAPFNQAFPNLGLTFTDLNNRIVATRHFTPDEYLGGELAGKTIMPQGQPVHLSLEIVDPGENALNYHLESID